MWAITMASSCYIDGGGFVLLVKMNVKAFAKLVPGPPILPLYKNPSYDFLSTIRSNGDGKHRQ
jgi:hypothetical protein